MRNFLCLVILLSITTSAFPLKILGLFTYPGKSHFVMYEPLLKSLADRGHEMHVYSFFKEKTPIRNYYDYSLEDSSIESTDIFDFYFYPLIYSLTCLIKLIQMGYLDCDYALGHKLIQDLYKSNEKFDLILLEFFNSECMLTFVEKFQAPYIYLSSSVTMNWGNPRFGNPNSPSYIPNTFLPYSTEMSYLERAYNGLNLWFFNGLYKWSAFPLSQLLVYKHLGSLPDLHGLAHNSSLILVNSHPALTGARPLAPNYIEVAGSHLKPAKKLPTDIQKWIDESPNGVIYFSFGSLMKTSSIPSEKVQAFLDAFREIKERIIWKWEDPNLPNKPKNLLISKWLPQRDILAHPKVKLFISHCGLMGSIEAVDSAVPTLCMPIFGDQPSNQAALQQKGISLKMDYYKDLTKEGLLAKLEQALQPEYQERAKEVQRAFRDRPMPPLDTAIYWVEYVGRHRGAKHLELSTKKLAWYQIALLDVLPIFITIVIIFFYISKFIFRRLFFCRNKIKTIERKIKE